MHCLSFGKKILAYKRVSLDKKQTIICMTNMSSKSQNVLLGVKENKYKNLLSKNSNIDNYQVKIVVVNMPSCKIDKLINEL